MESIKIINWLNYFIIFEMEYVWRLVISVILSSFIGLERELRKKPAGLRTHILVSLSSALLAIISSEFFKEDPARIIAHVITGIGFIGAGTIIAYKPKGRVVGVTTAACIFMAAVIGITSGLGLYLLASVTTVLTIVVVLLKNVEEFLEKK